MAWQISDLQLVDMYINQKMTPEEIGKSFKGKPMPIDIVIHLLKLAGFNPEILKKLES